MPVQQDKKGKFSGLTPHEGSGQKFLEITLEAK
jgi:hypothetical protein